jgi:hypothetical protein
VKKKKRKRKVNKMKNEREWRKKTRKWKGSLNSNGSKIRKSSVKLLKK